MNSYIYDRRTNTKYIPRGGKAIAILQYLPVTQCGMISLKESQCPKCRSKRYDDPHDDYDDGKGCPNCGGCLDCKWNCECDIEKTHIESC